MLYAQLALLALLPVALSVAALVLAWSSLARPWLFLGSAIAVSYVIYGLVMYFLDPNLGRSVGYMVYIDSETGLPVNRTTDGEVLRYFLQPYLLRMAIFAALQVPILWGLAWIFRKTP